MSYMPLNAENGLQNVTNNQNLIMTFISSFRWKEMLT